MIKLGGIELDVPFYQAPLSGYSEAPMRMLARRYGCPLTFTGVLLDKIALHPKAIRSLKFQPGDDEHPVGVQLLGEDPATMAAAAAAFEKVGYDIVDLNFACPVPKVVRRMRGGYLLTRPQVIIETLRRTREALTCPLSMKVRIGFDGKAESRDEFRGLCEQIAAEGVDMLTIHGRTVSEKYRGKADWEAIAEIKRAHPHLTVFGSGDLMDPETIVERLETTGVSGVAVARGAIGNPWIFAETRALLEGRPKPAQPTLYEQGLVMLEHFEMIGQLRPERQAAPFFRKFVTGYCKRHPQRKKAQMAIIAAKTRQQLVAEITEWFQVR
ncbi:MAG: tRNA-dihydrouridine synthase family protein [Phycisphaerae bacterium]|nr:tRNA-dihydrouridine synthase family protein [Phycisphaerae bacterium]